MSKSKKRTISELLKDRPEGRFISSGFDLLGEGARIMAKMEDLVLLQDPYPASHSDQEKAASDFSEPSQVAGSSVDLSAIEDPAMAAIASMLQAREASFAIESNAIGKNAVADSSVGVGQVSAIADFAVADNAIASSVKETGAIADFSMANFSIEGGAIVNNAIVKMDRDEIAIASAAIEKPAVAEKVVDGKRNAKQLKGLATREAYHKSHEEIERLKSEASATSVDNYVFDTLFKEINNPSEVMVYLYLWRRTKGSGEKRVELSYQVLSDAIGISKRAGQDVLKRLYEKKLVKINRESKTGIPSYEVLQPWNKK